MRKERRDANEGDIIAALREAGCEVWQLCKNEPADLLVFQYGTVRGWTDNWLHLLEVKDGSKPPSARKLTKKQVDTHAKWPVIVVETVAQALQAGPWRRMNQMSIDFAAAARDRAHDQVLANAGPEWVESALAYLRTYAAEHPEFICEEFREWAMEWTRLPAPHHHNAWGALMRSGALRGVIRRTDRSKLLKTVHSHARRAFVWEAVNGR